MRFFDSAKHDASLTPGLIILLTKWLLAKQAAPISGLLIGIAVCCFLPQQQRQEPEDSATSFFIEKAEVHHLRSHPFSAEFATQAGSIPFNRNLSLCIKGLLYGCENTSAATHRSLLYGMELRVDCNVQSLPDGAAIAVLDFRCARAVGLSCCEEQIGCEPSRILERLFRDSPSSLPFVGHRYEKPDVVARSKFGITGFRVRQSGADCAYLCNSKLTGKRVRLLVSKAGKLMSLQPLSSGLGQSELAWLDHSLLPKLAISNTLEDDQAFARVSVMESGFPPDLGFAGTVASRLQGIADIHSQTPSEIKIAWNNLKNPLGDLLPKLPKFSAGVLVPKFSAHMACQLSSQSLRKGDKAQTLTALNQPVLQSDRFSQFGSKL